MSGDNRTDGGQQPRPSRRSLLRGAAGVAGAGLAAGAVVGSIAAPAAAAGRRPAARGEERAASSSHRDPVIVHVRDARTGEMEIFSGTSRATLRDPQLARRLAQAVK